MSLNHRPVRPFVARVLKCAICERNHQRLAKAAEMRIEHLPVLPGVH
jgi:hypothetical protein